MKPKSFRKKLNLNKKTVANLNGREMGLLKGGMTTPGICTVDGNTCPCADSAETNCPRSSAYPPGYCNTDTICI
jgi:natural product precursor